MNKLRKKTINQRRKEKLSSLFLLSIEIDSDDGPANNIKKTVKFCVKAQKFILVSQKRGRIYIPLMNFYKL